MHHCNHHKSWYCQGAVEVSDIAVVSKIEKKRNKTKGTLVHERGKGKYQHLKKDFDGLGPMGLGPPIWVSLSWSPGLGVPLYLPPGLGTPGLGPPGLGTPGLGTPGPGTPGQGTPVQALAT